MRLIGFIRGENVIVATGGVEYSYEMLGERDPSLTDGDEVSFDTLASSAINIKRVEGSKSKDRVAQKVAPQPKESAKQNDEIFGDKNSAENNVSEAPFIKSPAEKISEDRSVVKETKVVKKFKNFKINRKAKPAMQKNRNSLDLSSSKQTIYALRKASRVKFILHLSVRKGLNP